MNTQMNCVSYLPNYFSIEDISVTQEKVECKVNTKIFRLGFLDPGTDSKDLMTGKIVTLPLWYLQELKFCNPYFSIDVPLIYENVHKAICEAETTNIELGKLHPFFYEYGRHLAPYVKKYILGKIIFETMRQRVRYLLDTSRNIEDDARPERRLDSIENKLYTLGIRTNTYYINWLQMKSRNICISQMVNEYSKKRKRVVLNGDEGKPNKKS